MDSNIVMLIGLVLILSLIVTLLVFCRKNIYFNAGHKFTTEKSLFLSRGGNQSCRARRHQPKRGKHQGGVNATTPDGSGTSLQFLYHERTSKQTKGEEKGAEV